MKITTSHTQQVWQSGDYAGPERRPTVRATIGKFVAKTEQYKYTRSHQYKHGGYFLSMLFGQKNRRPRELTNIQSIRYSRGVDTDVGTCQIVLANVQVRNDLVPESDYELDFPGYFTPNRGEGDYFDQWGYVKNEWSNWLVPDRIIRTFEGYGISADVAPEKDPHLYPSGVWLIDDVTIDAEGTITLDCRDLGRVLLDQVMVAPAVPTRLYPVAFQPYEGKSFTERTLTPKGGWAAPTYYTDSNRIYVGRGIKDDDGSPVVENNGSFAGHSGGDMFDGSSDTSFRSVGFKSRKQRDAFAWVQGVVDENGEGKVQAVRLDAATNGRHRVYISLMDKDGNWLGKGRIPYRPINVDIHANIPYVDTFILDFGQTAANELPQQYKNIKMIRYTFTSLPWGELGYNFNYRAAISEASYASEVTRGTRQAGYALGNYGDYTDVVRWLLAWAGFFWPGREYGLQPNMYSDGTEYTIEPAAVNKELTTGQVWGDLEMTGTKGLEGTKLDVDVFDQKPFMDGIAAIREVVGFDFWIDETGGAIFRLPNVFKRGCYIMPGLGGPRTDKSQNLIEIDERTTLTSIQVKLSSKNIRERIYVGNIASKTGAVVRGYSPDVTGLRRYAGWTDQRFANADECQRMADLIALKQSFLYRQSTITIPGNPAIQPDDQIIITERTTGEGYIHRVLNVASDWSAETGQWTYTLTTHWLGDRAFTNLAWHPKYLRNTTRFYLMNMGRF